jgi:hypothetical protein
MKKTYTVSKDEKSGMWYAHMIGFSYIPVFGSFSRSKRVAQKHAADMMALTLKEYVQMKG